MSFLTCTVGPPGGLRTTATVVEAVRHMLAAGDWPTGPAGRRPLVQLGAGRPAGTIDAVLQAFPEGASADHPDLALAHAAAELDQGRLEEAAAQLALAESHVESAPPARRRRLARGNRIVAVGAGTP